MQALVLDGDIIFEQNQPIPTRNPGEVLIKTTLAGICATDLALLKDYADFRGIPGHEFVGIVAEADEKALIGQRVVGEINCPCRSCPTCLQGDGNHCPQRTTLGIRNKNGVFADFFTLPRQNLHPVPDSISDQQAVFTEPLAAALEICQQIHIKPNDTVAIIGDGRLGILIAQVLALTGCDLTLIGHHPTKWRILQKKSIKTITKERLTKTYRANVVIECSGNPQAIQQARQLLAPRGHLVLKSTYNSLANLDLSSLVVDEITLTGSRCGPFRPALRLLQQGLIDVEQLIETQLPLHKGLEALQLAQTKGVMKVLLQMG